jgi:O-antigen biosynthesis protein
LREDLSRADAHHGFWREAVGNMYRNRQIGNFSAVSISCLAIRRELFESVGGFEEGVLLDVDLCLRLRKRGLRIVMLPHVELIRRGARADDQFDRDELAEFRKRWPEYIERDPFCNPNLKRDGSFEIDI